MLEICKYFIIYIWFILNLLPFLNKSIYDDMINIDSCNVMMQIEENKNAVDSFISKINSNVTAAARDARKLVNDQIKMVVETQKKLNTSMNHHREQQSVNGRKEILSFSLLISHCL